MNRQDIIDAAMQIAGGVGGDIQTSALADSDMTAEDLYPLAIRYAVKQMLSSGKGLQDVGRTFSITVSVVSGNLEGTLPPEIITENLDGAFLPDYPYSSLSPTWMDYQRQRFDNLLSYWVVHDGKFITSVPQTPSPPASVDIFAPAMPDIPSNPATALAVTPDLLDNIIAVLALALRGELKLVS